MCMSSGCVCVAYMYMCILYVHISLSVYTMKQSRKMIYQHAIFSWQIAENGEPEWRDKLNVLSQKGMEKLNNLIHHLSFQQRKRLTEYIFDALEKQDIHNVDSLKFFIPLEFLKFF